jgi:hypothetical protein
MESGLSARTTRANASRPGSEGNVSAMPPGDVKVHSEALPGRTAKSWNPSAARTIRADRMVSGVTRRKFSARMNVKV